MVYLSPRLARLQTTLHVTRDVLMNEQSIAQDIGITLAPRQMASIDTANNRTIKRVQCKHTARGLAGIII